MEITTPYSFGRTVDTGFSETVVRVREELAREGFGVLTEIDVQKKFVEKLGKQFRNYLILGACNPAVAYEALGTEINLGALLPCNVVVYTRDDGRTAVVVMDPVAILSLVGNADMAVFANQIAGKMRRVLAALQP